MKSIVTTLALLLFTSSIWGQSRSPRIEVSAKGWNFGERDQGDSEALRHGRQQQVGDSSKRQTDNHAPLFANAIHKDRHRSFGHYFRNADHDRRETQRTDGKTKS